jgi:precorrin-4 C11-methyltransferase
VSPLDEILDDDILSVQYVPRCVHVGLGLAHQAKPVEQVVSEVFTAIGMAGIFAESIVDFNTIDLKADEPVVKFLLEEGYKFNFYSSEQLAEVDVPNPSATVSKHVGTPSVCEASVLVGGGKILLPKQKGQNWTVAASLRLPALPPCGGAGSGVSPHIEIVGAGPGDPELISVRGKRFLENADLILYAGSLVPKELTYYAKAGATVRSSADMDLEEQFQLMKEFYDKGKQIVRLHTGDPCIYGAIQEQMAFFDKYGMDYHITPGISSFLAAAAELRSQFTIPERCQTIILTRGEGRTPMPDKEKLHMLASHQSTMCIFLSASLAEQVQAELLEGGYKPETPVACCYKLTWKDQRIYRGQLKDLAKIMKDNHLTLTTMIVVGDAIDNRDGLSKLYDGKFTHLFRKSNS